jgi:flagellar biosynthetic protein FliR
MDRILDLKAGDFPLFLLALFRVSGVMMLAPVFGSQTSPAPVKVFLSLALAALFWPLAAPGAAPVPLDAASFATATLSELGLGLLIGFAAAAVFAGVQFGGYLVDQELGILQANLLDPLSNEQISIMGQFKVFLATAVYLLIDGHHLLIDAVARSFSAVPLTGLSLGEGAVMLLADGMASDLFRMGVEIAAPALVTLFLVTIAMAFMARTVPEMNIFALGFSLRLMTGFLVLAAGTALFAAVFKGRLAEHGADVLRLLGLLRG